MYELPKSVVLNNLKYKILSPEGLVPFMGINRIEKPSYIHLKFSNGKELKCSEDHPIMTINGIVRAKNLTKKEEVETIHGGCFVVSKRHVKKSISLYDIVNSGTQHLYYSNDVVSHNCEFLGSSNTLIDASKLQQLTYSTPMRQFENYHGVTDIYGLPEQKRKYLITCDVARGVEGDFSAAVVFDVTEYPYSIACKYKSNEISPMMFPNKILELAKAYNDAMVLIEVNDIGQQVVDILYYDLEYEGVLVTQAKGRGGQQVGGGFGGVRPQMGVKTTKQVKRIGCANLKTLIESDKLINSDYDVFYELTRFIEVKDSYEAESGSHDDLVMCCVLFAWLVNQSYFKELFTTDVREQLMLDNQSIIDDAGLTFGFSDDHGSSSKPDERVTEREFYNLDIHPSEDQWGSRW